MAFVVRYRFIYIHTVLQCTRDKTDPLTHLCINWDKDGKLHVPFKLPTLALFAVNAVFNSVLKFTCYSTVNGIKEVDIVGWAFTISSLLLSLSISLSHTHTHTNTQLHLHMYYNTNIQ